MDMSNHVSFRVEPVLIVMEYVRMGNLGDFLRNNRHNNMNNPYDRKRRLLTLRDLTTFALNVSQGMRFISSKRVRRWF